MPGKFSITRWIGPVAWLLRLAGLTLSRTRYQEFVASWRSVRDLLDLCNAAQVSQWQRAIHHNGNLRPSGEHCRFDSPSDQHWIAIPDWQDRRMRTASNASTTAYERCRDHTDSDLAAVQIVVRHIVLAEDYPWQQPAEDPPTPPPPPMGIDWTTGREIR